MERNNTRAPDWIQLGILLVTLAGFTWGIWMQSRADASAIAARFARIEQRMDDSDTDRHRMQDTLERIEKTLNEAFK